MSWQAAREALSRLGAELELRRSGSSLGGFIFLQISLMSGLLGGSQNLSAAFAFMSSLHRRPLWTPANSAQQGQRKGPYYLTVFFFFVRTVRSGGTRRALGVGM